MGIILNSRSQLAGKPKAAIRDITQTALCAAIMFALQVALSVLPNIEIVSLLVILYTLVLRRKAIYVIYIFAMLEGLYYGFGLWWVSYLYVWTILALITHLCRNSESPLLWAVISGAFGLFFGALVAIVYLFVGGPKMAVSFWIGGITFDLIHCAANFAVCLVLFNPLKKALEWARR